MYRGKVFQTEESTFGFASGESEDSRTKPGEDVWKGREEWREGVVVVVEGATEEKMKALLCRCLMSWKTQLNFSDCGNCCEGIVN